MELELYIAGIGGQGVQMMAKVLAIAALAERRHVLLAGSYGFEMRGGASLASLVIGARPLHALPVLAKAGAAIVMSPQYLDVPRERLSPGALVVTDETLLPALPAMPDQEIVTVPALAVAREVGSTMVAGLAMLAGFNAVTGLVRADSLVAAMKEVVPSYRRQHIENNERAIRLGAERATPRRPIDLDAKALEAA